MGLLLRPWLATAGAAIVCALAAAPAAAEDLNEAYGPSWNCSYITAGMPIYDSCRVCERQGLHFFRDTEETGHCVRVGNAGADPGAQGPRPSTPRSGPTTRSTYDPPSTPGLNAPTPSRPKRDYWGAVAVALTDDHVAAGIAWNHRTEGEAQSRAIEQCNEQGVPGCHIVGSFRNGGCGYVTTGHSDDSVGWGMGSTAEAASENCESRGLDCKPPAGGCTAKP